MMTELLYLKDCYLREFDARVVRAEGAAVVLDRTAFYPEGGGQPSDEGTLNSVRVLKAEKKDGSVVHTLEKPLAAGAVHGVLDWERRYAHMRMHTAQHLLSAIFLDKWDATTSGNQLYADESRIDFTLADITPAMMGEAKKEFDAAVDAALQVRIQFTSRDDVLRTIDAKRRFLFERLPPIDNVRVIEIEGRDRCPCGGTHVANTREVGHITIRPKTENKGKGRTRISFTLEKPV
jgi:Ser-tRNA(Ala) deacylase AlaX